MLPVAAGANGQPPMPPMLASSASTPASTAAQALAMPVLRVLWKWQRSGMPGSASLQPLPSSSVTCARHADADRIGDRDLDGLAFGERLRELDDARGATSPSNGQPNAAEIVTCARTPAARAARAMSSHAATDSAVVAPWLRRLNVSVATTTMPTSSQPAATARSKPRRFSTSPM